MSFRSQRLHVSSLTWDGSIRIQVCVSDVNGVGLTKNGNSERLCSEKQRPTYLSCAYMIYMIFMRSLIATGLSLQASYVYC